MRVGVLGGGLQGTTIALALADRGVKVTLFDKNNALLSRAAAANEGKIHLRTGSFGSVTVSDLGGGVANFAVSVAPNYLVDTGAHSVLTFDPLFSAGGSVNAISNSHFTVSGPGSYGNSPFGNFTFSKSKATALMVQTPCQAANGQSLSFHVTNFTGLSSASSQYAGNDIFFALDIFYTACTKTATNDCTGVVGATLDITRKGDEDPPGTPIPGAVWLFGTVLAGGAGFGRWRKRKQTAKAA